MQGKARWDHVRFSRICHRFQGAQLNWSVTRTETCSLIEADNGSRGSSKLISWWVWTRRSCMVLWGLWLQGQPLAVKWRSGVENRISRHASSIAAQLLDDFKTLMDQNEYSRRYREYKRWRRNWNLGTLRMGACWTGYAREVSAGKSWTPRWKNLSLLATIVGDRRSHRWPDLPDTNEKNLHWIISTEAVSWIRDVVTASWSRARIPGGTWHASWEGGNNLEASVLLSPSRTREIWEKASRLRLQAYLQQE